MTRLKLALNFPRSAPDAIAYARHIASQLDGNPYFPALPVPIPTLLAHIDDVQAAEAAVLRGTHGLASERDAKLLVVVGDLEQEKAYVETVANQHGEDARAVAASSGFAVKASGGPTPWVFEAEQGERSGEVNLCAPRGARGASYDWQRAVGEGPWVDLPRTNRASTVDTGLTPGTLYSFRYRTLVGDVLGDWSDPITFRVS